MLTELYFHQESAKGWIRRSVTISRPDKEDTTLWLEVPERYAGWLTQNEEPLLRLALFPIMAAAGECRIHAEIDRTLLENLTEHMRIWQLWCPGTYFCPTLTPDAMVDRVHSGDRGEAICAFSGGVDASYALTTHHSGHWGALSLRVPAAIMIHGADIGLDKQDAFDYAFTRADESLKELGVELVPVRTNYREFPHNWPDSHLSAITAALSLFGSRFCRGILGSDDHASREIIESLIPYGMNYVTDHGFDSATFTNHPVGCDASRTQRCAFIAGFPGIMKNLRICWMSNSGGRNCGVCEKCIRTALNFMSAGHKGELPFDQPFTLEKLRELPIKSYFNYRDIAEVLSIDSETHALPDEVRALLRTKAEKAKNAYGTPHSQPEKPDSLPTLLLDAARYKATICLASGKKKQKYQRKLDIVRNKIKLIRGKGN